MNPPINRSKRQAVMAGFLAMPALMNLVHSPLEATVVCEGQVWFIGNRPELLPLSMLIDKDTGSVLARLNLRTGEQVAAPISMPTTSNIESLGDGRLVVLGVGSKALFLNADGSVFHVSIAPVGYRFNGGVLVASNGSIFVTLTSNVGGAVNDRGLVRHISFGRTKQEEVDFQSFGIDPVCLASTGDAEELAVLHSGVRDQYGFNSSGEMFSPELPAITVLDLSLREVKREISLAGCRGRPKSFVFIDLNTTIVGFEQYQQLPTSSNIGAVASMSEPVQRHDLFTGMTPVQQPLIRVAFNKDVPIEVLTFKRGFEAIVTNQVTGTTVATFSASDCVLLATSQGIPKIIGAYELGLTHVAGVVDIPGTPYVVLSGINRYAVLFDVATASVVARYRTDNYGGTQLAFTAVS